MKQALLATIGFSIFYGLQITLSKIFLKDAINPLHLNFLTCLVSFIFLTIYFLIFKRKNFKIKLNKKIPLFLIITVLWLAADLFAMFGLKISYTINYSILSRLGVIFTYILAVTFFNEKHRFNKILGVLVSFLGVLVVVYNFKTNLLINIGDLFFLATALSQSASGLFRQKITNYISSLQLTYLMFGTGAIILGVLTIIFLPLTNFPVPLFIIVNSMLALVGFSFVNYAIAKGGASFFSVASSLLPVATAIFSFLILKQLPTFNQIIGGILIMLAIFLFQKK